VASCNHNKISTDALINVILSCFISIVKEIDVYVDGHVIVLRNMVMVKVVPVLN
jgi:hypothetical protein